jgi:hypothetical protein
MRLKDLVQIVTINGVDTLVDFTPVIVNPKNTQDLSDLDKTKIACAGKYLWGKILEYHAFPLEFAGWSKSKRRGYVYYTIETTIEDLIPLLPIKNGVDVGFDFSLITYSILKEGVKAKIFYTMHYRSAIKHRVKKMQGYAWVWINKENIRYELV